MEGKMEMGFFKWRRFGLETEWEGDCRKTQGKAISWENKIDRRGYCRRSLE